MIPPRYHFENNTHGTARGDSHKIRAKYFGILDF